MAPGRLPQKKRIEKGFKTMLRRAMLKKPRRKATPLSTQKLLERIAETAPVSETAADSMQAISLNDQKVLSDIQQRIATRNWKQTDYTNALRLLRKYSKK